MIKLLAAIFLSFSVVLVNAQPVKLGKQLDELLSSTFKASGPGCAVLVASKGNIIYNKAFGSASIELGVPLKSDMLFKIASLTKQFTAVAILQLAEQGKLLLQDSIQRFIASYPSKTKSITIEHLLTHTSGIPDYMQLDFNSPYLERWDFSPAQLIDSFKNRPLQFEPGSRFAYSNSGYYLLGYIVEKVSGKPYEQYITDHLLKPLNMEQSFFDINNRIIPNKVNGYVTENNYFKNADYWSSSIAYAAGGLLSNTGDLYKWFSGLLQYKILKKETLQKAFTAYRLADGSPISYGYGWYVQQSGNLQSIEHAGIMNGFVSNLVYFPQRELFVVALFNNQQAPKDAISKAIAEAALGQPLQSATYQPSPEIIKNYIGKYELTGNKGRSLQVYQKENTLFLKVSGQDSFELLFQSPAVFELKNIKDMKGEFITENGRAIKIMVQQNGDFEWKRVE